VPRDHDPLIEAAVRKIDDLELQLAARRELEECIIISSDEESIRLTVEHFDRIDRSARPDLWRWLLLGAVLILSLLMATPQVMEGIEYRKIIRGSFWSDYEGTISKARQVLSNRAWSSEEEMLLFGGSESIPVEHRLRALRQMAQDDPAMLAEYMAVHVQQKAELPPDLRTIAARIDPDNSFFDYLSAAFITKGALKEIKRSPADVKANKPRLWEIKDSGKVAEAMALMAEAAAKPGFASYTMELTKRRAALLSWDTREQRLYSSMFVFPSALSAFSLRQFGDAIVAEAQRLATAGDGASFLNLADSTDTFMRRRIDEDDSLLIGGLILSRDLSKVYQQFAITARELDLSAEAERYSANYERLQMWQDAIRAKRLARTGREVASIKTRIEMSYELPLQVVAHPPPVDEGRLLAGTFADHAMYSRALVLAICALFALTAGILVLHRSLASPLIRSMGKRMSELLGWKSCLTIAGISFIPPTIYLLIISRLTPFGARQFNLRGTYGILPTAHFVALFLMIVILAILAGRWRLSRCAPPFALGRSWASIPGWLSLATAAAHMPTIGWLVGQQHFDRQALYAAGLLLVPGISWLLVIAFKGSFGSPVQRLGSSAMARILIPVCGLATIWMLLLLPLFQAEENHWIRKDHFNIDPSGPDFRFTYEESLTKQLYREIREAIQPH